MLHILRFSRKPHGKTCKAWAGLAPIGLAFLGLSGCVNLQALNSASQELISASSSWNGAAQAFEASCRRINFVSNTPVDCSPQRNAGQYLFSANKILIAYFSTLQQASDHAEFSIDPSISSLTTSLDTVPGVSQGQMNAVSGLASYLAGLATSGMQNKSVQSLLTDGAPQALRVLDVMSNEVVPQLSNVLQREHSQTQAMYVDYLMHSATDAQVLLQDDFCTHDPTPRNTSALAYLLEESYCTKLSQLSPKQSAIQDFQASLQTAHEILKNLYNHPDQLNSQQLATQLSSQGKTLKTLIGKFKLAFAENE